MQIVPIEPMQARTKVIASIILLPLLTKFAEHDDGLYRQYKRKKAERQAAKRVSAADFGMEGRKAVMAGRKTFVKEVRNTKEEKEKLSFRKSEAIIPNEERKKYGLAPIPEGKGCPHCGSSCDMDDNYCWKCGKDLKG